MLIAYKKESYLKKWIKLQFLSSDHSISFLACGQLISNQVSLWETQGENECIAVDQLTKSKILGFLS